MKIIAESAFNHNGNLEYLKDLAIASKVSKADYFTVQVMNARAFCVEDYSKYELYINTTFSESEWIDFFDFAKKESINIIPCVLEEQSFILCYSYGFRSFKLHATDITNIPFLQLIKEKGDCKLFLETQCSTYQDIEVGMEIISDFVECLFHGYSNYPTELEDLNLNAIDEYKNTFPGFNYGFADHSPTIKEVPLLALGKGYDYLEKHITLSRNNRNFDWQVSLYPDEFSIMVNSLDLYSKALGIATKHPVPNELSYRNILFKKVIPESATLKRSDIGKDFLQDKYESLSKDKVGIALIARLKSQRLKRKVLKPFLEESIIQDLMVRLKTSKKVDVVKLATSALNEDHELVKVCGVENSFVGHPISVLDRMLSFARKENVGGVFRVTGDNPFTDPNLIDMMVNLFVENDLDYCRVNNVPFGVSAELFSTSYLWNLYLHMENPLHSEYLSWFVLNDVSAKKGCVNYIPKDKRVPFVNLSVDYPEDYERVQKLLKRIDKKKANSITLDDIVKNLDLNDIMDVNKEIKLPEGKSILFNDYLELMNNVEYSAKIDLYEK